MNLNWSTFVISYNFINFLPTRSRRIQNKHWPNSREERTSVGLLTKTMREIVIFLKIFPFSKNISRFHKTFYFLLRLSKFLEDSSQSFLKNTPHHPKFNQDFYDSRISQIMEVWSTQYDIFNQIFRWIRKHNVWTFINLHI